MAYGRLTPDPALAPEDQARQARTFVTCVETEYTAPIDRPDARRTPRAWHETSWELTGFPATSRFDRDGLRTLLTSAPAIAFEQEPGPGLVRRQLGRSLALFEADDLSGPLPAGTMQPLALLWEQYSLALTAAQPALLFGGRVTDAMLAEAGYVHASGDPGWWVPSGRAFYSPSPADTPAQERAFARAHFFRVHRRRDPFGGVYRLEYDPACLLVARREDPAGNVSTAEPDYRVVQTTRTTDANGNRSAVLIDALGAVAATAVMGKAGEIMGDSLAGVAADLAPAQVAAFFADPRGTAAALLGGATSRVVYDFDSPQADPTGRTPAAVATITRERHLSDLAPGEVSPVRVSITYHDGLGRAVQRKAPAEPGPLAAGGATVSPRWVGSEWIILDNKGNPVQSYEPFFSATHAFEFGRRVGVATTLFHDPLARVIAALHPDGTWVKRVFDPWSERQWDENDTVALDPRTDPGVRGFMTPYLASLAGWQPWVRRRIDPAAPPADVPGLDGEQAAAVRALAHRDTPTRHVVDAHGRVIRADAHNGIDAGAPRLLTTRVRTDVQGNEREVIDTLGRLVRRSGFDLHARALRQESMDAGARWSLPTVLDEPLYSWDERGHRLRHEYDGLRRLVGVRLAEGGGAERLVEQVEYGEAAGAASNHRGRVRRQRDASGVTVHEAYDFEGNVLSSTRQLAADWRADVDWSGTPALEPELHRSRSRFDALRRPIQTIAPHVAGAPCAVLQPRYNEAGLLEATDLWPGQAVEPAGLLAPATATVRGLVAAEFDARGTLTRATSGNGTVTRYEHDPLTFRLARLVTTRPGPSSAATVQDLAFTYDAAGNVVRVRDAADLQNVVFFRNRRVDASSDYTYEPVYRLRSATGREHLGLVAGTPRAPLPWSHDDAPRSGLAHPGDGNAVGRYTETYEYDEAGNLRAMRHTGASGSWARTFAYSAASLLEPGRAGNRLASCSVGASTETFSHDPRHGMLTAMPHLAAMRWDFKDQLRMTERVAGGGGGRTWYVYDAGGARVRKVTEAGTGAGARRVEERIYLGGFELHRTYQPNGSVRVARETVHLGDGMGRVALVESRAMGVDPGPARLVRWQYGNHLGSAMLELDDQASVISYEEYSPFGSTTYRAARSASETPKRYRFTGKERDEESGFYYHGHRYYAPWLARWTSPDPAGLVDGPNLYVYAGNDPVGLHDDTGMQAGSGKQLDPDMMKKYEASLAAAKQRGFRSSHPSKGDIHSYQSGGGKGHGTTPRSGEGKPGTSKDGSGTPKPPSTKPPGDPGGVKGGDLTAPPGGKPGGSRGGGADGTPGGKDDKSQAGKPTGDPYGQGVDASGYQQSGANAKSGVGGTGKEPATKDGTALSEMDYATLLVSMLSPTDSGKQDKDGVSGGLPGGEGPKWMGGPAGQALYIAVNLLFTFGGGLVERGLQKLWAKFGPMILGVLKAPAYMFVGMGGGSGFVKPAGGPKSAPRTGPGSNPRMSSARTQPVTAAEQKALDEGAQVLKAGGTASEAGTVFHEEMGAAGPGQGVDKVIDNGAAHVEYKSHWGGYMDEHQFTSASDQSLGYSVAQQQKTGLVPIRIVKHYYANPAGGPAVKSVGH